MNRNSEAILTLEPLIDAVRLGIEGAGWSLSGLQKTTSHQFEGRWAGDSTRSAYLFFHLREGGRDRLETQGGEADSSTVDDDAASRKPANERVEGEDEGSEEATPEEFVTEGVEIDVYLDETSRGLRGNIALVLDGPELARLGSAADVLQALSAVGTRVLPSGYRRPLSLRFRLDSVGDAPGEAETQIRFKIQIPHDAFDEGRRAVGDVAERAVKSFEELLEAPEIDHLIP